MTVVGITLSDLVERGGAYAGIAAFFGLAVLVILYFAQARELKRLREWAGRAPERALEVEERVVAQAEAARRARTPAPAPAAAAKAAPKPKPAAAKSAAVATAAGATAATGAATAQAAGAQGGDGGGGTAVIPVKPGGGDPQARAGQGATTTPATPGAATPASPAAAGNGPASAGPPPAAGTPTPPGAGQAPEDEATDEPAQETGEIDPSRPADGVGAGQPVSPGAATAAGRAATGNGAPGVPSIPRGQRPAPRTPASTLRSGTTASRRPPEGPRGGTGVRDDEPGGRPVGLIAAVAGAVVVVVVLLVIVVGGGGGEPTAQPTPTNEPAQSPSGGGDSTAEPGASASPEPLSKDDTQVAVLNGTTISGLAGQVADRVRSDGFGEPTAGNWSDTARAASVVFYTSAAAREQAIALGELLGIEEVERGDSGVEALGENADVVVVVGADQSP